MIEVAQRWLDDQRSQQRELLLVVDRLGAPDPIADRKSTRLYSRHTPISHPCSFFLIIRHPPTSTLFPYTTLFRSQRWLDDQGAQQRELLLVVDRLADPDPIAELFGADLMQDYVNLYQGTEFADMADAGPWLVHLTDADTAFLYSLLETPNQHWGWLASAEHID